VGKNKLKSFKEISSFEHVLQPKFLDVYNKDYYLKGNWSRDFFKNNNPVVLELGCGKGEYTTGLAELNPHINYIGIDIKGARICKGAKTVLEKNLKNVAFIRSSIEPIQSFFAENEVSEIWLTFSDPQPNKPKKRLSSSVFLNKYNSFLKDSGIIHLKTDSKVLFEYTCCLVEENNLKINYKSDNVYCHDYLPEAVRNIHTFYEKKFIAIGKSINYLEFELNKNGKMVEPIELTKAESFK
jgi:tRNA (guanine-N7-)-methyltransferase